MFSIVAFKTLDISQGSVATHMRCSGIFSDSVITNFLLILTVNFENRLIFDEVKAYKKLSHFWAASLRVTIDYTVNHKKRDILFFTITSANLNRFL